MTNQSFPSFIAKWSVAAALLNITTFSMAQQTPMPTMRANDKVLRIVNRHKGKTWTNRYPWLVNPELKPDVYETSAQKVTFISDCDSISFNVEPGGVYDFAVLLNGRDSAYTRIEGISDNPLEDPPARIRTISPSGLLSRRQAQFDINALIYAINGIPARTMLEHMMEGMSGERYFFRLARVEGYFQTLFQLMYKVDEYTVEYRESGSRKTRRAVLPATRQEEIRSRIAKKKTDTKAETHTHSR